MANERPTTLSIAEQLSIMFRNTLITETNLESPYQESSTSYRSSPVQLTTVTNTTTSASLSAASASASSSSSDTDNSQASTIREEYQIRTLGTHNIARLSILPIYPPFSLAPPSKAAAITATTMWTLSRTPHLIMANVPIESLTDEQYARIRDRAFPSLFKIDMDIGMKINPENNQLSTCESFLLSFYQNLYGKLKKRLKVDIPIIDFNLTRLRHCVGKVAAQRGQQQTMLNIDELGVALEFYLQMDVDMFFLKTCSFNDVKPRLFDGRFYEGLFCIDTPEPRFVITPCNKQRCLCCHSPCPRRDPVDLQESLPIPFSIPHIHRFVNQYEAILNCPATCESTNCIYVLTCPCGHFDFIGQSKLSFAATLAHHREESNRIIREFLIGEVNMYYIAGGLKSDEKKGNDKMWLYQHSLRCSVALQLFLEYNPDYWCFVPMKLLEINMINSPSQRSSPRRTNDTISSSSSSILSTTWTRMDAEVRLLVENVPKPPLGFDFSINQREQQRQFFQWVKDRIVPLDNVDVYNADIIAILPNNSSELFRQLIESLFITHAECKLNEIGHLVYEYSDPNRALHGSWCANLTRRPLPSLF